MLVLSRKSHESIIIGNEIEVTIVDVRGDKVRVGINAPNDVSVHRKEVWDAIRRENQSSGRAITEGPVKGGINAEDSGDRPPMYIPPQNEPQALNLWNKENLLNTAISELPSEPKRPSSTGEQGKKLTWRQIKEHVNNMNESYLDLDAVVVVPTNNKPAISLFIWGITVGITLPDHMAGDAPLVFNQPVLCAEIPYTPPAPQ